MKANNKRNFQKKKKCFNYRKKDHKSSKWRKKKKEVIEANTSDFNKVNVVKAKYEDNIVMTSKWSIL